LTGEQQDIEQKLFWESIYEVFDKAYRGLRSKIKTGLVKDLFPVTCAINESMGDMPEF